MREDGKIDVISSLICHDRQKAKPASMFECSVSDSTPKLSSDGDINREGVFHLCAVVMMCAETYQA